MEEIVERINKLSADEYHRLLIGIINPYMEGDHATLLRFRTCSKCGFVDVEVNGRCTVWFYDCKMKVIAKYSYAETVSAMIKIWLKITM
jgi:hypothetical protein